MSKLSPATNGKKLVPGKIPSLKKRAQSLRSRAEELSIPLSSTQSLELLAASEHDRSWNVMQARYQHASSTNATDTSYASEPITPNILLLARPGYGKSTVCHTLTLAYAHKGEKTLVIAGYPQHPLMKSEDHVYTHDITSWCDISDTEIRNNYNSICKTFAQSGKKILVLYFEGSLSREPKSINPCLNTIAATQVEHKIVQWSHVLFDELPYSYESSALYTLSKHYHTILSIQYTERRHVLKLTASTTFNKELHSILSQSYDSTTDGQLASLIWSHSQNEVPRDMWFAKLTDLINAVLSTQNHWDKYMNPVDAFVEHSKLSRLIELAPQNTIVQGYLESLGNNSKDEFNSEQHDYIRVHIFNAYRSIQFDRPWHCIELGDDKPDHLLDNLDIAYTHINTQTSLACSLQWSALEVSLSAYTYQSSHRLHRRYFDFARCLRHDPILLDICTKAIYKG